MSFWVDGSINVSMDYRSSLETGEREQRLVFVFGENNVTSQPEHFKQLHGLFVYFGEDDLRAALFRDVDDAEQDRDADTVDELRIAEIDNQRPTAAVELSTTLAFDLFAGKLVQIVAGINNSRGTNAMRPYQRATWSIHVVSI